MPATAKKRKSDTECRYWTPEKALEECALPIRRTLFYQLLRQGVIPSLRLGKKYIIPKAAFEKWLENCGKL